MFVHDVTLSDGLSQGRSSVQMTAMGQNLLLQLEPSRFNKLAQQHSTTGNTAVLLKGTIEGDQRSWVRASMQDGQLSGHLFHHGKLYQLEHSDYLDKLNTEHQSASNSDHILFEPATSGNAQSLLDGLSVQTDHIRFAPNYSLSNKPEFNALLNQAIASSGNANNLSGTNNAALTLSSADGFGTTVTRALRIGIVVDSRFNEVHKNRGLARALSIISAVDAIYQSQLGIAVIVDSISVYDDAASDPMRNNGGTVNEILANFRKVRMADELLAPDLSLVHLFTGHRDPNRVIGLGWLSTACRLDGYDISVSTPFPFDTLLAAHEIAHNLGAVHDDDVRCAAEIDNKRNSLMWPEISGFSTTEFSNCSRRFIQPAKNASCNLDNIDASINIISYPSSEELRRSVVVQVSNNDQFGRATEMMSVTTFPAGTRFSEASAGCIINNTDLECNHGTVYAGDINGITVSATLANKVEENVVGSVELLNATDVYDYDNRQVIQLINFVPNSAEAILPGNSVRQAAGEASSNDFVTRLGMPSVLLLIGLAIAGLLRRRAYAKVQTP